MVRSNTPLVPIFPAVPRPGSADYPQQLTRWLQNTIDQLTGFTYVRLNGLMLASTFPQTGVGLKPGEVFLDGDILRVVKLGGAYLSSVSATAAVGTITVTV